MPRTIKSLVISLLTLTMLWSQQAGIPYIENIQIDGKTKDWKGRSPIISFIQDNKGYSNEVKVYGGWNELNLFVLFEVSDEQLISLTEDSSKIHLNDAVEFFIDPLLDSEEKMDINDYQFIVGANDRFTILKGDYRKTDSVEIEAPKEHGISTLIFKHGVSLNGILNDNMRDTGYRIELSIPFSAIGIEPREGIMFKADFCVDDADSLVDIRPIPDSLEIPGFFFSSWKGEHNFSFPKDWSVFVLKGKPSAFDQFLKSNSRTLLWLVIGLVLISVLVISILSYRIAQLKNVPQKSSITQFESIQHYIDEPLGVSDPTPVSVITEEISQEEPEVIKKARNFIHQNLENEIEVEKLASVCAVSSRQLQRIFKDHLSITPSGFIVIMKMEEALRLLKSGKYNVTEVAYHLGYSDAAYFTRVFKKYFGYPPSQALTYT